MRGDASVGSCFHCMLLVGRWGVFSISGFRLRFTGGNHLAGGFYRTTALFFGCIMGPIRSVSDPGLARDTLSAFIVSFVSELPVFSLEHFLSVMHAYSGDAVRSFTEPRFYTPDIVYINDFILSL